MNESMEAKPVPRRHWVVRWSHRAWMAFAILLIITAIFFGVFRALTPWATQYQSDVEHHLSALVGQPVTIQSMQTSWYWFQPVLKLNDVALSNAKKQLLTVNKLLVGIDLFSSLWHWQIQPGVLYVDGVHLQIKQKKDGWDINGITPNQSLAIDKDASLQTMNWLLAQQKIIIKHVSADVQLKNGTQLPLTNIAFMASNKGGHYQIKGMAALDQAVPTAFSILADMTFNPSAPHKTNGHVYLSLQHVLPVQWQSLFSTMPYVALDGQGDVELWFDILKGGVDAVQSTISLQDMVWRDAHTTKKQQVPLLKANLAWQLIKGGWELKGDHVQLVLGTVHWPENQFQVSYQYGLQTVRMYVKQLLIESALTLPIHWPASMQSLLAMHPHGQVMETQLHLQEGRPTYLLTRVENLGWEASKTMLGMQHLSGVVHWEPTEGRLELDANQVVIQPIKQPPVTVAQLNLGLDWKTLSHGLRVSLDHFIVGRSDLVVSASGVIDEPFTPAANLRLAADFSAEHAEQWLAYLPSTGMKPKLTHWLKQDIKRIKQASGQLKFTGLLADFPFDNHAGDFSITSRLSGVDLYFHPKWPLARDIDASLSVDKRNLVADVYQADLQGIAVDAMNLRVDNMGQDRETLLVHGNLTAPLGALFAYVAASPLKQRLSSLTGLTPDGDAALGLRLEVPLYPENNTVLVEGMVHFDNNAMVVHPSIVDIPLQHIDGDLYFNEHGLTASTLNAVLWGEPMAIQTSLALQPEPSTHIKMVGNVTMDALASQLKWPIFSTMKGRMKLDTLFIITDNPLSDNHLQFSTDMRGVAIDLPEPLAKKADTSTPFTLDLRVNANKAFKLGMHYKGMAIDASRVGEGEWSLQLKQASLGANLRYQSSSHSLSGTIDYLYLNPSYFKRASNATALTLKPSQLPNLALTIQTLKWGDIPVGQLTLKSSSSETDWKLDQAVIKTPSYTLTAKGVWTQHAGKNSTLVDANLQIKSLADSLMRWHITPAVHANKGDIQFKGGWPGSVSQFRLSTLNGEVYIALKHGRITDLSPETEEKLGLGKLLSILSLQTIPRRLKLDFSDLSQKGYSFDAFEGRFTMKKGVMHTMDSYIDGPVAYAGMKGELDLVNQLYDLDLHISPHITASLPIVATIAGGPIAGVAAWVASKIINKGMQRISGYSYKVSGPWKTPVVQQVSIVKKQPEDSH